MAAPSHFTKARTIVSENDLLNNQFLISVGDALIEKLIAQRERMGRCNYCPEI